MNDILTWVLILLLVALIVAVSTLIATLSRWISTYCYQQRENREQAAFFRGIASDLLHATRDSAKAHQRTAIAVESLANDRPIVKENAELHDRVGALVLGVNDVLNREHTTIDGEREDHAAGRRIGEDAVKKDLTTALAQALKTAD